MRADAIIKGLEMLKTYGDVQVSVAHDTFYAGVAQANRPTLFKDARDMFRLGWYWEKSVESWFIYV